MTDTTHTHDDDAAAVQLPLLNARTWAIGFFVFAVVLAVVFSVFLVDFMRHAH